MSDLVFEKLPQALGASESLRLNIAGDFFRLSEAAYPVSVSLLKNLRIIGTMRNMLAGDYVRDIAFDGVIIDNGATAQTVTAQIAGGGAGSDRVLGEVSVINGELAAVKAGKNFAGFVASTALAGNFSMTQLWNAGGGGVIVTAVSCYSVTGAMSATMSRHNAAIGAEIGVGKNKRFGAADAAFGKLRSAQLAASVGSNMAAIGLSGAYQTGGYQLLEPIYLDPGEGLVVQGGIVNSSVYTSFQWREEA